MGQIGPATHHTVRNRPRLKHLCVLCGEPIVRGERYHRWLWKDGGDLMPCVAHDACDTEARQYDWFGEEWCDWYPLREQRQENEAWKRRYASETQPTPQPNSP